MTWRFYGLHHLFIGITDYLALNNLDRYRPKLFYAHYQDVFAVLEELENDFLSEMNHYLDEAIENKEFSDPLSLLQKFQRFVENSIENNRLLLANQNAAAFCEKVKRVFVGGVMESLPTTGVKDTEGF